MREYYRTKRNPQTTAGFAGGSHKKTLDDSHKKTLCNFISRQTIFGQALGNCQYPTLNNTGEEINPIDQTEFTSCTNTTQQEVISKNSCQQDKFNMGVVADLCEILAVAGLCTIVPYALYLLLPTWLTVAIVYVLLFMSVALLSDGNPIVMGCMLPDFF